MKKLPQILILLLIGISFINCNNKLKKDDDSSIIFNLEEEFLLRNSEKGQLKDQTFSISVLEINDSRCPEGVNCIRAGEIRFKLLLKNKKEEKTLTLSYPARGKTLIDNSTFGNYTIRLIKPNQKNKTVKSENENIGGIFVIENIH